MTLYQNRYRIESTRLPNYNYASDGTYFVTIVTKNRVDFFGKIIQSKEYTIPHMQLSTMGKIVKKCWLDLPNHYPNCILDEFRIMPNHVHGIIIIDNDGNDKMQYEPKTTNKISSTNRCHRDAKFCVSMANKNYHNKFGPQTKILSSIIRGFKIGITKYCRQNTKIRNIGMGLNGKKMDPRRVKINWGCGCVCGWGWGCVCGWGCGWGCVWGCVETGLKPVSTQNAQKTQNAQNVINTKTKNVNANAKNTINVIKTINMNKKIGQTKNTKSGSIPPILNKTIPKTKTVEQNQISLPIKHHSLSEMIRAFKTFSARQINAIKQTPGKPVWQSHFHDHIIRNRNELNRIRQYIIDNPRKWGRDRNLRYF
jgi:putative transposase